MKNAISAMNDGEVRSRLDAMEAYNEYFRRELDAQGLPLTQHIVGAQQRWNIMTREWGVDPTRFGITEPPAVEWNGKIMAASAPAQTPTGKEFGHDF